MIDVSAVLKAMPWADSRAFHQASGKALAEFGDPSALVGLFDRVLETPALLDEVEIKRDQTKVVLHREHGSRRNLTLHVYGPGHETRRAWIHNHRWNFSSRVLRGSILHEMYEPTFPEGEPVQSGPSTLIWRVRAGDNYVLMTSQYHRVAAEPWTVSLLLRDAPTLEAARYFVEGKDEFLHGGSERTPWAQVAPSAGASKIDEVLALRSRLCALGVMRER